MIESLSSVLDWGAVRARVASVAQLLQDPHLEVGVRQKLQREYSALEQVIGPVDHLEAVCRSLDELALQQGGADPEFAALVEEELAELEQGRKALERELEDALFPSDELDAADVFLEIRAGAGGQEAALFAGDLLRMYTMYAARMGWRASVVSESPTDLGGYREVVLHIVGKQVYGHLKRESGVHRVQRVPATETSGRIHTSTATVAVLPEVDQEDDGVVAVDPKDLRIDVYRSSGAGGQHVNTTDSAVRITHLPTGIVVACQDERSQHKNKAKALKVLRARLVAAQREKEAAEQSAERKRQIGSGERSEKVRTYNFPQNRVSDHQADVTLKSLDLVMEGQMHDIIEALQRLDRTEQLAQPVVIGGFTVPRRADEA